MSANPLTPEQIEQLRQAKQAIPLLEEQIRLAKQAGLDVSQQEVELRTLKEQVERMLSVYGNMPPAS